MTHSSHFFVNFLALLITICNSKALLKHIQTHICHSYLLYKSYQNNGSRNLTGVKRTDSNSDACMYVLYLPTKSLSGLAFSYLSQPCSHWLLSLLDCIHVITPCAAFINVRYLVQSSFILTDLHMSRIGFLKSLCLFSCFIH